MKKNKNSNQRKKKYRLEWNNSLIFFFANVFACMIFASCMYICTCRAAAAIWWLQYNFSFYSVYIHIRTLFITHQNGSYCPVLWNGKFVLANLHVILQLQNRCVYFFFLFVCVCVCAAFVKWNVIKLAVGSWHRVYLNDEKIEINSIGRHFVGLVNYHKTIYHTQ